MFGLKFQKCFSRRGRKREGNKQEKLVWKLIFWLMRLSPRNKMGFFLLSSFDAKRNSSAKSIYMSRLIYFKSQNRMIFHHLILFNQITDRKEGILTQTERRKKTKVIISLDILQSDLLPPIAFIYQTVKSRSTFL